MAKTYPLEIQNVGEDVYILMSKGHHDPHEFMAKAREIGYDWPLGMPAHEWTRTVPSRNPEWACFYHPAKEGDRGAYPTTYAREAWGKDRYEEIAAATPPQDQQEGAPSHG